MIKPIETEYKGYRFRSRLEARWALFFDLLNIEWEYEPEGIILSDGTYYLPDFYLPRFHCFFEVKRAGILGSNEAEKAIKKISNGSDTLEWAGLIAFGDPMDDNLRIFCQEFDDGGGGQYDDIVTIGLHPEYYNDPYLFAYNDRRERTFYPFVGEDMDESAIPMVTHEYNKYSYGDFVNDKVKLARKLARQARFEHGAVPGITPGLALTR